MDLTLLLETASKHKNHPLHRESTADETRSTFIHGLLELGRLNGGEDQDGECAILKAGISALSTKGFRRAKTWLREAVRLQGWQIAASLGGTARYLSAASQGELQEEVKYWMLWSSSPEKNLNDTTHPLHGRAQVAKMLRDYSDKFRLDTSQASARKRNHHRDPQALSARNYLPPSKAVPFVYPKTPRSGVAVKGWPVRETHVLGHIVSAWSQARQTNELKQPQMGALQPVHGRRDGASSTHTTSPSGVHLLQMIDVHTGDPTVSDRDRAYEIRRQHGLYQRLYAPLNSRQPFSAQNIVDADTDEARHLVCDRVCRRYIAMRNAINEWVNGLLRLWTDTAAHERPKVLIHHLKSRPWHECVITWLELLIQSQGISGQALGSVLDDLKVGLEVPHAEQLYDQVAQAHRRTS